MLKVMLKQIMMISSLSLFSTWALANSIVQMKTTMGDIHIETFDDKAPISTANFKKYVTSNFYKGTIFHRVIPKFMVQGGGFTAQMQEKPTLAPIKNEASNGLSNKRGTLAMARTNDPNSASSQFFINVVDNNFLDAAPGNAGYAVFAKVTKGMNVVDKIVQTPTTQVGYFSDVPVKPIVILDVKIVNKAAKK